MKHILSVLILAILVSLSFPQRMFASVVNQLVTELKVVDNDTTYRYVYLYDTGGKIMLETKYFKQNNLWNRISQTEWMYEAGNCINQTERTWNVDQWINTHSIEYSFISGLVIAEIHIKYADKIPFQYKKMEYFYTNSLLSTKVEYLINANLWTKVLSTNFNYTSELQVDSVYVSNFESGTIANQFLIANKYNAMGSLDSQIHYIKNSVGVWVPSYFVNWFYKPQTSVLLSQRTKIWLSENAVWQNYQRTDYDYNASNQLVSEIYQHWKSMFWKSDLRYNYQYDSNANKIKRSLLLPIYNEWRAVMSLNYSNFTTDKANLMESKYDFWGGNSGELTTSFIPFEFNNELTVKKARSLQISYLPVVDVVESLVELKKNTASIAVYPNPSDGIFYVDTQKYSAYSWAITDLSGRCIKNNQHFFNSGVIDLTDLPRGIYILKVNTKTTQLSQKLIKQ